MTGVQTCALPILVDIEGEKIDIIGYHVRADHFMGVDETEPRRDDPELTILDEWRHVAPRQLAFSGVRVDPHSTPAAIQERTGIALAGAADADLEKSAPSVANAMKDFRDDRVFEIL